MERVLTVEQMREADRYSIETLKIEENELIERAGLAVAEEIFLRFKGGRVLVCLGKGNNGKDGKVVARHLRLRHGFSVKIFSIKEKNFNVFDNKFDVVVDCLFGTGLNRELKDEDLLAVEKINKSNAYVVSCDIPSGLNGNNGKRYPKCVKANLTIAIQDYKIGHFINDGIDHVGELIVKDIGISIWDERFLFKLEDKDVAPLFESRKRNVNKGNFGKVCIFGGSVNFTGSVLLSLNALTALKTGVGYANLTVPKSLLKGYIGLNPECTLSPYKDIRGIVAFDKKALEKICSYQTIALGMGMGNSKNVYKIIKFLLKNYNGNLLIDADGLNALSKYGVEILKNKKCNVILTPHVAEFSRLINKNKSLIVCEQVSLAQKFAKNYGVTLVLKNAVSVITDGEETYINTTGCSALAKAGSGDVLSGVISGIVARSGYSVKNVASASYVFGLAGEIACKEQSNEYTVTASDVINCLAKAVKKIKNN